MIYLRLFYEFFKIGLFSIGGGLATLPFLYKLSDSTAWFDSSAIADMLAVSESTPGPIGVNMATYVGFNVGGIGGAVIATLGLVMPSLIIIILVANFMTKFSENTYVKSAFYALRPCVTGLIAAAGFEVFKISLFTFENFVDIKSILNIFNLKAIILFILLYFAIVKYKKHPIVYILASAAIGIILNMK